MRNRRIIRPAVSTLHCDAIHTRSTWADWRDMGGSEAYDAYEATACEECGAPVVLSEGQGGGEHREWASTDCRGYVSMFEGPAMCYAYELPRDVVDPYDAAPKIAHLPLCLIEWRDKSGRRGWALALTGGGMDLSWEICEAFMMLGELPPLHFAGRLQDMGKSSRTMRYVLNGARKSIRVARNWLQNDARTAARLLTIAKEKAAREKQP